MNTGLVLEGGGMRGVYTAGVLEYFMERDLYFPYNIGVSAGASNATSYLARQKGRNRTVNIDYITHPEYLSFRNYLKKRQLFGMDFIFDVLPNQLVPFDFEAFYKAKEKFVVGTTDCITGETVYYNNQEHGKDMLTILRASCSLPFIAPIVSYNNKSLLDGGISNPIPIRQAEKEGYSKNVVILTRNRGYRKKPSKNTWISKKAYKNYPGLLEKMESRANDYNETLDYLFEQEENGNVFIIQPTIPLKVGRMEKKPDRLLELYNEGYEDAKNIYDSLLQWLEK
ncbi:patatin-like phospholipase family protein [Bacillus suaedaesalsae]|uniref:Patatin family protein n=1 Tax=Bacillus suaedaesalsae TaxID=2810349 RepID=A0ABS2DGH9_9BACI|nr:patatin family protein [Bacillus suaedaesalsae]MBM6617585.1 patatin family protein [Bacillus suaedaesalsae]